MSELINTQDNRTTIRWKLLTSASAFALAATISSFSTAEAADTDRPVIWLEAGGQIDQLDDGVSKWVPDFVSGPSAGPLAGQFLGIQKQPLHGFDANAAISFQSSGSDWSLAASVQIGRARQPGSVLKTAYNSPLVTGVGGRFGGHYITGYDGKAYENESHLITDFEVGRDVGLGLFGAGGNSTLHAGVRLAQFSSRTDVTINTQFPISYSGAIFNQANTKISRKFDGAGPSIAWNGSVPIAGTAQDGELAIDWAANAALLFGRQMIHEASDEYTATYANPGSSPNTIRHGAHPTALRKRNVTVPNLGGLIGISYRMNDARLTLGYRADFFFNAIDGGVATRKEESRGFFGPYASISIGLGGSDN